MRGLKRNSAVVALHYTQSHPTRVRGLKHQRFSEKNHTAFVAPHAGAWIETYIINFATKIIKCRTPRGCVDCNDDYLQRRVNVLLAYIAQMNTSLADACETIMIEPEIVPYIITSDIDDLNYWMTANGNKPVVSQEESIVGAGISKNPEETMRKLDEQATRDNSFIIGEPQLEGDA